VVAVAARSPLNSLRRAAVSPWAITLCAAGVGGIALRVWVYRSVLGIPDADEGVVGLTARHILDGQFPSFIWGLTYGGIQELIPTAGIFWIFGSSWVALRIVPIILGAVTSLVIWRVGRRTFGEPAATVAGLLFWVWPGEVVYQLTHQYGYYASDVFYCALLLLLGLRVVDSPSTARAATFGLVAGLAFWQTSHVVPVLLPVVAWVLLRRPEVARKLWIAAPLAVLGALPWLLWNVKHDWASLNTSYGAPSTYAHRVRIFFSPLLPMVLGVRQYGTQKAIVPEPLILLLLAVLAGLFVFGAVKTRRGNASLLYFVALAFPFLWAISQWTVESSDPRYMVVFTPLLALFFGHLATTRIRGAGLVALGAIVSVVFLHDAMVAYPPPEKPPPNPPRDFRPLISTLDRLGVHYVYSSHWVAYRLAFETNERIIGVKSNWTGIRWDGTQAQPQLDTYIRYWPYEHAVRAHRHAFVFYRQQVPAIAARLPAWGYRRYDVGSLIVYWLPPRRGTAGG
jgi:4-amino-4-deoxy-L-arabinose transferase-like glycosyltransferase